MYNIFRWAWVHFLYTFKWFHLFLSNMNTQLNDQTVLFQTIQFSISSQFLFTQLNVKTVLLLTIQFSISTQFKCQTVFFDPWIGSPAGATTLGHSIPGSDGNEGVLCIPQSSSITGTSPSDCLVSYPGHFLMGILPLCRGAVCVFYSPS